MSLDEIDVSLKKLNSMGCTIEQSTTSHDQYLDCWTGNEQHIPQASLPLMLLKRNIGEALRLLTAHRPGQVNLSTKDVQWAQSELQGLLALSQERAAFSMRRSGSKDIRPHPPYPRQAPIGTTACKTPSLGSTGLEQTQAVVVTHAINQNAPAGNVPVRAQWTKDGKSGSAKLKDLLLMLGPTRMQKNPHPHLQEL
ncbi:hypothetical protein BBP40_004220 [Aspergillus hancockii]|nr:hypothetical protein BBP40_004220 [Aspergillus hancockii]